MVIYVFRLSLCVFENTFVEQDYNTTLEFGRIFRLKNSELYVFELHEFVSLLLRERLVKDKVFTLVSIDFGSMGISKVCANTIEISKRCPDTLCHSFVLPSCFDLSVLLNNTFSDNAF